nr:PREDICTED: somatolactin-like [Latimeria chalumnae]|eukprot:XP_014340395.1 PREDICTED: somatolactin-like [Latimeria chalumnae]
MEDSIVTIAIACETVMQVLLAFIICALQMVLCGLYHLCLALPFLFPFWSTMAYPLDCKDEQGSYSRCTSISLEKLLDRAIQHTELIYTVTEESCAIFEEKFVPFPLRSQKNRGINSCYTKGIHIPGSKSEVQQISDKALLHSVLILVQSWTEPFLYLQKTLDRYDSAPGSLLNKTKWVSDKLPSLEQGVLVLIRKMLDEGLLTTEYQQTLTRFDVNPEVMESVLRDYTILNCFRKDVHRMETFLKLLKCRQSKELSCYLP